VGSGLGGGHTIGSPQLPRESCAPTTESRFYPEGAPT
jgi:hypothetical protein